MSDEDIGSSIARRVIEDDGYKEALEKLTSFILLNRGASDEAFDELITEILNNSTSTQCKIFTLLLRYVHQEHNGHISPELDAAMKKYNTTALIDLKVWVVKKIMSTVGVVFIASIMFFIIMMGLDYIGGEKTIIEMWGRIFKLG